MPLCAPVDKALRALKAERATLHAKLCSFATEENLDDGGIEQAIVDCQQVCCSRLSPVHLVEYERIVEQHACIRPRFRHSSATMSSLRCSGWKSTTAANSLGTNLCDCRIYAN